jgi:hypothetical protein
LTFPLLLVSCFFYFHEALQTSNGASFSWILSLSFYCPRPLVRDCFSTLGICVRSVAFRFLLARHPGGFWDRFPPAPRCVLLNNTRNERLCVCVIGKKEEIDQLFSS